MFAKAPDKNSVLLDETIHSALMDLKSYDPHNEEYVTTVKQLTELYNLKKTERSGKVSPDVAVQAIASLGGILLIIGHERANVITSKALNFIMKVK